MNATRNTDVRLAALARIVEREAKHLATTDTRLFQPLLSTDDIAALETNEDLAERVEAFIGRFGRLQDTLGDKLLPALLARLGDRPAGLLDNLDRAERLGWIEDANQWINIRDLRNKMVHEYMEDPTLLADALNSGHHFAADLIGTAGRMTAEVKARIAS